MCLTFQLTSSFLLICLLRLMFGQLRYIANEHCFEKLAKIANQSTISIEPVNNWEKLIYFLFKSCIISSSLGDKIISVRRFAARPSGVALVARGKNSPLPDAVSRVGSTL